MPRKATMKATKKKKKRRKKKKKKKKKKKLPEVEQPPKKPPAFPHHTPTGFRLLQMVWALLRCHADMERANRLPATNSIVYIKDLARLYERAARRDPRKLPVERRRGGGIFPCPPLEILASALSEPPACSWCAGAPASRSATGPAGSSSKAAAPSGGSCVKKSGSSFACRPGGGGYHHLHRSEAQSAMLHGELGLVLVRRVRPERTGGGRCSLRSIPGSCGYVSRPSPQGGERIF